MQQRIYHSLKRFTAVSLLCLAGFRFFSSDVLAYMSTLSGPDLNSFRFFVVTCLVIIPLFAAAWLFHNRRLVAEKLLPSDRATWMTIRETYVNVIIANAGAQLFLCLVTLAVDTTYSVPGDVFEWIVGLSIAFSFYIVVTGHKISRLRLAASSTSIKRTGKERVRQRMILRRVAVYTLLCFFAYVLCAFLIPGLSTSNAPGISSSSHLVFNHGLFVLLNSSFTLFTLFIFFSMNTKIDNLNLPSSRKDRQTIENLPEKEWPNSHRDQQPSFRLSDIAGLACVIIVWLLVPFFRPDANEQTVAQRPVLRQATVKPVSTPTSTNTIKATKVNLTDSVASIH